jgi:hypothetical protein
MTPAERLSAVIQRANERELPAGKELGTQDVRAFGLMASAPDNQAFVASARRAALCARFAAW